MKPCYTMDLYHVFGLYTPMPHLNTDNHTLLYQKLVLMTCTPHKGCCCFLNADLINLSHRHSCLPLKEEVTFVIVMTCDEIFLRVRLYSNHDPTMERNFIGLFIDIKNSVTYWNLTLPKNNCCLQFVFPVSKR